jgi:hypothetical protein
MAILGEFDPTTNGWFFENWGEASPYSWDLYRRTYLAINPTQDLIAAPLDCAFYEIFKSCGANGNCGGIAMLGLALYKYGGFLGFCSPASFYTGAGLGPDRADLHAAVNIMQARQFSAPGIRNFLDVVKAGDLNNGETAFNRIKSGLASGDYAMLSLSNGIFGDAAHTVIPYKVEEPSPGTKVMHIWDPNRPFDAFPGFYTGGNNKITITGPTSWTYDQNAGGFSGGTLYNGSMGGWCFAIPISLELHKARQPISVGFILTGLTTLFVSGIGAAVTQIEDDTGRRFYKADRAHRRTTEIETSSAKRLDGVARWPWFAAGKAGELPGELFFLERPPGSPALTVTVRGPAYNLVQAQAGNLLEVQARSLAPARDRIRVEGFAGDAQAVELRTDGAKRVVNVHQLRAENADGDYRSMHIRDAEVTRSDLKVETLGGFEGVEVSSVKASKAFDLELRRYRAKTLAIHSGGRQAVAAGRAVRLTPGDWDGLSKTTVERSLRKR